jgi:hypothetical protein
MLRKLPVRLLSFIAPFLSLCLLVWTGKQLPEVFRLSDPTGAFGAVFNLTGFVANIAVIFLFFALIRRSIQSRTFFDNVPLTFILVFGLKLFEGLNLLPCFIKSPGELCGVTSIMISYISSPLILFITANVVVRTADRRVRQAGLALAAVLLIAGAAAWWRFTPQTAEACTLYPQITAQANCLRRFALESHDVDICRKIDFRSTRYDCMRRIAEETGRPELCDEIQTPPDARVSGFETPASEVRDICYFVLAFNLRSRDLCQKIEGDKKDICLKKVPDQKK